MKTNFKLIFKNNIKNPDFPYFCDKDNENFRVYYYLIEEKERESEEYQEFFQHFFHKYHISKNTFQKIINEIEKTVGNQVVNDGFECEIDIAENRVKYKNLDKGIIKRANSYILTLKKDKIHFLSKSFHSDYYDIEFVRKIRDFGDKEIEKGICKDDLLKKITEMM